MQPNTSPGQNHLYLTSPLLELPPNILTFRLTDYKHEMRHVLVKNQASPTITLCQDRSTFHYSIDGTIHRWERRAFMRRRPQVDDKPCRDFQTLGIIKGQRPRIVFFIFFHPKHFQRLCHLLQPSNTSTSARSFALPDAFLLAIKSSSEIIRTGMPSIVFGTALVTASA